MLPEALRRSKSDDGAEWLSVSDMMTGLMVIFLFIAISYMQTVREDNANMRMIAETYTTLHQELYNRLLDEFRDDLPRWEAEIDRETLSVTFNEPEVLFSPGLAAIQPKFMAILDDFFPRYVAILRQPEFIQSIREVRIEGHTSSDWKDESIDSAYFKNMWLSQERTRAVLMYVMELFPDTTEREWLRSNFTANGLSSSHVRQTPEGEEDRARSRRVEFRVRTNAEERFSDIMDVGRNEAP